MSSDSTWYRKVRNYQRKIVIRTAFVVIYIAENRSNWQPAYHVGNELQSYRPFYFSGYLFIGTDWSQWDCKQKFSFQLENGGMSLAAIFKVVAAPAPAVWSMWAGGLLGERQSIHKYQNNAVVDAFLATHYLHLTHLLTHTALINGSGVNKADSERPSRCFWNRGCWNSTLNTTTVHLPMSWRQQEPGHQ